jgi:hypothetical protein
LPQKYLHLLRSNLNAEENMNAGLFFFILLAIIVGGILVFSYTTKTGRKIFRPEYDSED